MKDKYVHFSDNGFLEKTLDKHFKERQQEGSFTDVGLKFLYSIIGPNDLTVRAVYEVLDNKKFVSFALQQNLNFLYTTCSSRTDFDTQYNKDSLVTGL